MAKLFKNLILQEKYAMFLLASEEEDMPAKNFRRNHQSNAYFKRHCLYQIRFSFLGKCSYSS